MKFGYLLIVLFMIEIVFPEWTLIWVSLMIFSTVCILECVWTRFTLLCFKMGGVSLLIHFAIPCEIMVMFWFVWSAAFNTLHFLNLTWKCHMPPFPAVFALGHAKVYIHPSDCGDVIFYIETSINKVLYLVSTLNTPNVQPNDGYVWFWRYLDNI